VVAALSLSSVGPPSFNKQTNLCVSNKLNECRHAYMQRGGQLVSNIAAFMITAS
jgi:hypothetical protein